MNALIFCNGDVNCSALELTELFKSMSADLVIAADGGIRHADVFRIKAHYIIGDLDSISPALKEKHSEILKPDSDTNSTDSEKAILLALELGAEKIFMVGATGSRFDHSFANLQLLGKYRDTEIHIIDLDNDIFFVNSGEPLPFEKNQVISLLPLMRVKGIRSNELKYIPDTCTLDVNNSGVHNVVTKDNPIIEYDKGILLVDKLRMTDDLKQSVH